MKVVSYTIVHYGADYLGYALRSVYDQVDRLNVIYTPTPSHGTQVNIPPIETKQRLMEAAFQFDTDDKVHWYDIKGITHEGQHRDEAVRLCQSDGADLVLVVDCDEIWHGDILNQALQHAWEANSKRNWLINFSHLWRSFDYVCHDQGWPVRILDLRHNSGDGYIPHELGDIYHFGYAIRDEIMSYKWRIHGHKNEMRRGWLNNQWAAWPPVADCHPTNAQGFWNPVSFDKLALPEFMRLHPFYNLEKIE